MSRPEEQEYRASFELANVGQAQVDPHSRCFLSVNRKFADITGYSREELLALAVTDLSHPEHHQRDGQLFDRLVAEEIRDFAVDRRYVRKDGREVWVHLNATLVPGNDSQPPRVMIVVQDITVRKAEQDEIARLNRDLKRRVEELQTVLDVAPVGIAVAQDTDCQTIVINPAAAAMLSVTPETNISLGAPTAHTLPFRLFEHGRELPVEELPLQQAAQSEIEVCDRELDLVMNTGVVRHLLIGAAPLYDEQGKPRGCVGSFVDITDRRRHEQSVRDSEERLKLAQTAASAGTWEWDVEQGIFTWSDSLCDIYGLDPAATEANYDNWLQVVHPYDRQAVDEGVQNAMTGHKPLQLEFRIIRPDGDLRWIAGRGKLLRNSENVPIRLIGISLDITPQKMSEQRLKQLNETLEQRVAERTAMAEQRTQQLRDLASEQTQIEQRERRRLASDLHDYLAQLLVVCKMDLGRLKKFVESPVGIDMITEMDRLLNDSLTYTRTLVAELSPTILYEAGLGPAFEWLAGQMHGHGLEVLVHDDGTPVLLPDDQAILVFQAARELLFNVIKHAGVRQATIDLATSPSEVVVTVSDQGEGFDIDPRTDRPRSGGFGLFNVRERLEAINGRFEISSTAGEGTTATLVVPLPGKPLEEPASSEPLSIVHPAFPASVPEPEQRPIRVLLVDDHLAVRRVLRRILESDSDLQLVGEAVNGVEAVDMARSLCPDVVLMDVNMPVMSGIEATRRIRQENLPVAVIALSANDDSGPVSPMKEAGAVAYLTKGASLDELRRTIRSACPSVLTTCMPPP